MSFTSRLEVLGQYIAYALCEHSIKFDGHGKVHVPNKQCFEVPSGDSMGFDVYGNEYFLFYPDILLIIAPNNQYIYYKCLHYFSKPLSQDDIVYNEEYLNRWLGYSYDSLNYLLRKKKIFHEQDIPEHKMQIEMLEYKTNFYGFDKCLHDNQEGHARDSMHYGDAKFNTPQGYDDVQYLGKIQFSAYKYQEIDQYELEEQQLKIIRDTQATLQVILPKGLSYIQLNPQIVYFQHQTHFSQNLIYNFYKMGGPSEVRHLVSEIVLTYLKSSYELKDCPIFITQSIHHLVSCISSQHQAYYQYYYNDFLYLTGRKLTSCIIPLSYRANFHKLHLLNYNTYNVSFVVKRPINYRVGNLWILQQYPIWLWERATVSKRSYVQELLSALGYDEPIYEEPPEEEPESEEYAGYAQYKSGLYSNNYLNYAYENLDTYYLDDFVVDNDESGADTMYSESPEEMRRRQARKYYRRLQKLYQRQRHEHTGGNPAYAALQRPATGYGFYLVCDKPEMSQLDLFKLKQEYQMYAMKQRAYQSSAQPPAYQQLPQHLSPQEEYIYNIMAAKPQPPNPDFLNSFQVPDMSKIFKK